jgi:DNA-binding beta-propeller fold protein YncE
MTQIKIVITTIIFVIVLSVAPVYPDVSPQIELISLVNCYSDRQAFGHPNGIFFEPVKSEIYVADTDNNQIAIFDNRGTTLWSFRYWVTDSKSNQRTAAKPISVVARKNGDIIASFANADYLAVFDYQGVEINKIMASDFNDIRSFRAAVLALDGNSHLFVGTKIDKTEILKFDLDFNLVLRFGEKGDAPHQFSNISGISIGSNNQILVTDLFSIPVLKIFDNNGEYKGGFGGHEEEKMDFSFPASVAVTRGGRIWIVDSLRQVVKCLTENGEFVTMIGGYGTKPGEMVYPAAITSDGDSVLVVAEKNGNRFQQFLIR